MTFGFVERWEDFGDETTIVVLANVVDEGDEVLLDELIGGVEGLELGLFLCGLFLLLVVLSEL